MKTSPTEIYNEYSNGIEYNTSVGLYDTVLRNNKFYNGDQWGEVNAPDLDKPVFNILKLAVNYDLTQLISDDFAISVEIKKGINDETDAILPYVIKAEVDHVIEQAKIKLKNRTMLKNCIVDGDGCHFIRFDSKAYTGFDFKGAIDVEVIDNTNVIFGKPNEPDPQKQPYILIVYRRLTDSVQEEAKENKQTGEIKPDDPEYYPIQGTNSNKYTTVILKMWKENGLVCYTKVTKDAVVKPITKPGYRLYPVPYMTWERVKNSYHGMSPLSAVINNQKFINKLYAMAMMFTQKMAFPKLLYDMNKLPQGWDNKIGKAIGVNGNPNDAIFANFASADMSASVPNLIMSTIEQTKQMLGVHDTALGQADNVSRTASSTVMMLQKAASSQLEVQRLDFKSFIEDEIRIIVDMMRVHYGKRPVVLSDMDGSTRIVDFDFRDLEKYVFNLNIEIGSSAYWDEIMQNQTLNNMMQMGILDPVAAITAVPSGALRNKDQIIEHIKTLQEQAIQGVPNENM